MSKGLTVIAFIFVLPFIILGGLWMIAKRRPIQMSPGSVAGNVPRAPVQTSTAQGNAPGGAGGAVDILNASARVLQTATPILKGFFDSQVQSNNDYEADPSEAAVSADDPISAPFLDAVNVF